MFETQPLDPVRPRRRRRRRAPEYYWHVTVTPTQVGYAIHETKGAKRHLCAVIVDEAEAWDYAGRRANKRCRILADRSSC